MTQTALRPLVMEDLDNIMTWVNDPEIRGNFQNFTGSISRDDEKGFLEKILASPNDKPYTLETEDGKHLGMAGIHQIYWPSKTGRLSVIVGNKDNWNLGYGQSALKELIRKGFDELHLHKLWVMVFEENSRARYIYQKLGFIPEGILRDEYLHKGKYHNVIRMSMLENEYYEIRRGSIDEQSSE